MQKIKTNAIQKPVFFDLDGSIDDLVSLIFLLTLDKFRLTGVSLTGANCIVEHALQSILRVFSLFCRYDLEVAVSDAKPVNPFPRKWQEKAVLINELENFRDIVPDYSMKNTEEASDFTAKKILSETEKTTIICTGPATNLYNTINKYPEVTEKIEKIYWMAGAFMWSGNVIAPDHDGSAEWNIFWDPLSARNLIKSGIKIVFFPLDVCTQVPVDNYVMYYLEKENKSLLSQLVYRIFNINYHNHPKYYMWDVLPSMYLGYPDLFRVVGTSVDIEMRGTSVGNIFKTSKGSPIRYANSIDDERFYTAFLKHLKRF
ncbi:MAG: nucleoside hydrolase [Prolixibacteraceae bacterium]|nr:nucleoside hydrolase [Prolixibacteraceae bacterium]